MEWYYLRDGKTMGPVPEGSIRAWLESGFLQPEDLLWRAGMKLWVPAVELPEFGGRGEPEQAEDPAPESRRDAAADGGEHSEGGTGPSRSDADAPGGPFGVDGVGASGSGTLHTNSAEDPGGASPTAGMPGGPEVGVGGGAQGASPWKRRVPGWSDASPSYASIWARTGAAALDLMLLVAAVLLVFRPELPTTGNIEDMAKLNPAIRPVFMGLAWLYFGLLEGSTLQASLGKLAFGLKVTDLDGNRLLPGRAMVRGLFKVVLMAITAFLSFLPAAFTARRQALHDIVSGSTVLIR